MSISVRVGVTLALLLAGAGCGAAAPNPQGEDLAGRLGCFACHSREGRGQGRAVSLEGVGARLIPPQLRLAVTYPRRLHPQAQMPSYAYIPPREQDALMEFLITLK